MGTRKNGPSFCSVLCYFEVSKSCLQGWPRPCSGGWRCRVAAEHPNFARGPIRYEITLMRLPDRRRFPEAPSVKFLTQLLQNMKRFASKAKQEFRNRGSVASQEKQSKSRTDLDSPRSEILRKYVAIISRP